MPILTEQIQAGSLNLTDFVHIARPTDLSQSPNGSSYKATIGQLIDANGAAKSQGGTSGNDINGISDRNPKKKHYIDAANNEIE